MKRNYATIRQDLDRVISNDMTRNERMSAFVDALWPALSPAGVSWLGFYSREPGSDEMILEARRDKPACSPIGLHGACGQSCISNTTLIVTDVANLGEGYVACDPRDLSELVIPLINDAGDCWGVYDADSFYRESFDESDALETASLLWVAGLTSNIEIPIKTI
jgi:putative methionine-R-sulfoxide reductase with GAF domain